MSPSTLWRTHILTTINNGRKYHNQKHKERWTQILGHLDTSWRIFFASLSLHVKYLYFRAIFFQGRTLLKNSMIGHQWSDDDERWIMVVVSDEREDEWTLDNCYYAMEIEKTCRGAFGSRFTRLLNRAEKKSSYETILFLSSLFSLLFLSQSLLFFSLLLLIPSAPSITSIRYSKTFDTFTLYSSWYNNEFSLPSLFYPTHPWRQDRTERQEQDSTEWAG